MGISQAALAKMVGVTPGAIGNYESQDRESSRKTAALAAALRVRAQWLESGLGPMRDSTSAADDALDAPMFSRRQFETASKPLMAREVSYLPEKVPSLTWEELMAMTDTPSGPEELPGEFWLTLSDDAMAPTAGRGTKVKFTRDQAPRFGDAVLLLGPDGAFHVRQYGQSLTYGFQALPSNPLYAAFHGAMPGVKVIAVLSGIETSWMQLAR